jgi:GNAT superfamily N-acetyltransferase
VGFVTIQENFPCTCEIHVMGILQDHHRKGVGRELVIQCAGRFREKGFTFMTVKTLAEPAGDAEYAATRAFYRAMGFLPVDVFPTLWDEHNPCMLMCKKL